MCTVVCRFEPGAPLRILALRDEFIGRESDGPDAWWPEQPDVIGGRDRVAGGTWCASDVRAGVTAVVLNRPDKHEAGPGGGEPRCPAVAGRPAPACVDRACRHRTDGFVQSPAGHA